MAGPSSGSSLVHRKALTTLIGRALGFQASLENKFEDKGLYAPRDPQGRDWIYFMVTGLDGCIGADGGKKNKYAQAYIGISSGEPAHGHFELVKSYPLQPDQLREDLQAEKKVEGMKREWQVLLAEFKNYFMGPTTVTFINNQGLYIANGKNQIDDKTRDMFTRAINDALHLQFPITFEGHFNPSMFGGGKWPPAVSCSVLIGQVSTELKDITEVPSNSPWIESKAYLAYSCRLRRLSTSYRMMYLWTMSG
ncbi:hypothetical protein BDP27DRAFT_1483259 [Rhodocollybia butyracea]|uniref:Uncharacterized protein n=1 Tax=Rhodocollybia butyracea TaxID=206335 RepID=A0A9P5PGP3_9AGAR|nr:hypothetical protein BDP27DRAFT_1483259 [Rhodocollybia butyracea]